MTDPSGTAPIDASSTISTKNADVCPVCWQRFFDAFEQTQASQIYQASSFGTNDLSDSYVDSADSSPVLADENLDAVPGDGRVNLTVTGGNKNNRVFCSLIPDESKGENDSYVGLT